jgi:hypothetical protein
MLVCCDSAIMSVNVMNIWSFARVEPTRESIGQDCNFDLIMFERNTKKSCLMAEEFELIAE